MENSVRKEAKPGRGNDIRRYFLYVRKCICVRCRHSRNT